MDVPYGAIRHVGFFLSIPESILTGRPLAGAARTHRPKIQQESKMNGAHLHLLVNHVPIVGFAFGLILLVATILRRGDRGTFAAAVLVLVISGAGGLAAQFTGEPAEEVVEQLSDVPGALIESHEGAALIATILASITSLSAVALSFVTLRREGRIGLIPLSILLAATLATCGAMTWVGARGGKIRHTEIRGSTSTPPASAVRGDG